MSDQTMVMDVVLETLKKAEKKLILEDAVVALGHVQDAIADLRADKLLRSGDYSVERSNFPLVDINIPELFRDEEFLAWLNEASGAPGGDHPPRVATWHRPGETPNEFSDAFFTMEIHDTEDYTAEGTDSDMPLHAWKALIIALRREGWIKGGVFVWLKNLE